MPKRIKRTPQPDPLIGFSVNFRRRKQSNNMTAKGRVNPWAASLESQLARPIVITSVRNSARLKSISMIHATRAPAVWEEWLLRLAEDFCSLMATKGAEKVYSI